MYQSVYRSRSRNVFVADDTGSATLEWTVAVAIVVMMAVPIMIMIGKGSEIQSDRIAISIQDADSFGGDGFHGGEGLEKDFSQTAAGTPSEEPGVDLGIGFSDDQASAGDFGYGLGRNAGTRFHAAAISPVRRDKPAGIARPAAGNPLAGAAESLTPDTSGVNLPQMPTKRIGFGVAECSDPIDHDSITEASYTGFGVVTSGR